MPKISSAHIHSSDQTNLHKILFFETIQFKIDSKKLNSIKSSLNKENLLICKKTWKILCRYCLTRREFSMQQEEQEKESSKQKFLCKYLHFVYMRKINHFTWHVNTYLLTRRRSIFFVISDFLGNGVVSDGEFFCSQKASYGKNLSFKCTKPRYISKLQ